MSREDSETHVSIVAWLHVGLSILGFCVAALVFLFFVVVGLLLAADEAASLGILAVIGTVVGGFLFLLSVPGLVGGIGLLKRQDWARLLVIIISVLHLFNVPVGTAVGVYSLWALTRQETAALFSKRSDWQA